MSDSTDQNSQINKLQHYLDSMQVGTWEWNVQTGELAINARWAEIVGFSLADLTPVDIDIWTWLAHPDDLKRSNQALQEHFSGKSEFYDMDVRIRHKNGSWVWVHDRGQVMEWTEDGKPLWMFGTHEDVTHRIVIEQQLQALLVQEQEARGRISATLKDQTELDETNEKYRLIAEMTHDIVFVINVKKSKLTFISGNVLDLLGYSVPQAMQLRLDQLFTGESLRQLERHHRHALEALWQASDKPVQKSFEFQHLHQDGHPVWVESTVTYRLNSQQEVEVIGATRDISERRQREEQLLYTATHDPLTGLLNRTALQRMSQTLIQGLPDQATLSALLINVDNFHGVNDTLGHSGGDQVLCELAQVLQTCAGSNNQVFRYSGDEFLVLTRLIEEDQVTKLARSIQAAVARQFKYKHHIIQITVSIGICLDEPYNLDQIILNADIALYVAKKSRNTVTRYSPSMAQARTRAEILAADLSTALGKNEFELYYQPIFDIKRNHFGHAEALMRWNHPQLGQIAPGEFIPLAERTRLIIPMTDWAIREACSKLAAWKQAGLSDLVISVNLSAVTLEYRRNELVRLILDAIEHYQVCPSCLLLEITETALVSDVHEVSELFTELKKHGVKLALDDFGTGYATFGALNDLPIDVVKLDRSLIRNLETKDRDRMILDALFKIVQGLDHKVVVEGVETKAQFDWLCQHGCDYIQGFYFSRPLPDAEFRDFLRMTHIIQSVEEIVRIAPGQMLPASAQSVQSKEQPQHRSRS
ncbi:MAG: EAL domain-containing protein [Clostridiales bacterium]|nr:EAL domain-containing protein [Clostridiales bacterium]